MTNIGAVNGHLQKNYKKYTKTPIQPATAPPTNIYNECRNNIEVESIDCQISKTNLAQKEEEHNIFKEYHQRTLSTQ